MSFDVAASAYDAFMGRYSAGLASQMADLAHATPGQRVIDVGCGPGALTAELVRRLGPEHVAAVDPSEPFVEAARARLPGVDVRLAAAEALPHPADAFDAALAQLVVHFMKDPVAGLGEMRRVTRPDGAVVVCVWDFEGGRSPLSPFWSAALQLDPDAIDESRLAGARRGHLVQLLLEAGLRDVTEHELRVDRRHETFDEWWAPFAGGVGPAGGYLARLNDAAREALRDRCRELLPEAPFTLKSVAWSARGIA